MAGTPYRDSNRDSQISTFADEDILSYIEGTYKAVRESTEQLQLQLARAKLKFGWTERLFLEQLRTQSQQLKDSARIIEQGTNARYSNLNQNPDPNPYPNHPALTLNPNPNPNANKVKRER
jgi:hypothetical protein